MAIDLSSASSKRVALTTLCVSALLPLHFAIAQALPAETQSAYIGGEKDFEDMSQQERDAAKAIARQHKIKNGVVTI